MLEGETCSKAAEYVCRDTKATISEWPGGCLSLDLRANHAGDICVHVLMIIYSVMLPELMGLVKGESRAGQKVRNFFFD